MGKNIIIKRCKYCFIQTSQTGICNGINCTYSGEKTDTIEATIYDSLATNKQFKICPTCKQELPALDNYFHRSGGGYFDYCHECQSKHQKDWSNGRSVSQK